MKVKHHSAGAQQRERERERERGASSAWWRKLKVCLSSITVDEILQFNSFQKDFYKF